MAAQKSDRQEQVLQYKNIIYPQGESEMELIYAHPNLSLKIKKLQGCIESFYRSHGVASRLTYNPH